MGQLERADDINENRLAAWQRYYEALLPLQEAGKVGLPVIPEGCIHNGHMFYLKTADLEERTALLAHLKARDIMAVFHYVPLHTADAGKQFGRFVGEDRYTTVESERLVRLPMWYGLSEGDQLRVVMAVEEFYM